jgi:hypothetical protein
MSALERLTTPLALPAAPEGSEVSPRLRLWISQAVRSTFRNRDEHLAQAAELLVIAHTEIEALHARLRGGGQPKTTDERIAELEEIVARYQRKARGR